LYLGSGVFALLNDKRRAKKFAKELSD